MTKHTLISSFVVFAITSNGTLSLVGEERQAKKITEAVLSVAFSPDGKTIAAGNYDKRIRLYDAVGLRRTRTFKAHQAMVTSVTFSPDGKLLASGSADKSIKIWDVASGTVKASLAAHSRQVQSVRFSPNGRLLASVGHDPVVCVWDFARNRLLRELKHDANEVYAVAFSPDGKSLAAGGLSVDRPDQFDRVAEIKLWNPNSGELQQTLQSKFTTIWSLGFSPDGKSLAGGGDFNVEGLSLWDVRTGTRTSRLGFPGVGHEGIVTDLAFTPDGKQLATAGLDKQVILWDVHKRKPRFHLAHQAEVNSVSFSPDGRLLVSGSLQDNRLQLWNSETGKLVASARDSPEG